MTGTSARAERFAAMQQMSVERELANDAPAEGMRALLEGIAQRRQVAATYNQMAIQIAPHVLYTRAEMLYVAGVVTRRRGEPICVAKLGIFKVDGLSALRVLTSGFEVDPTFDPADPRFAATTIFAIERP